MPPCKDDFPRFPSVDRSSAQGLLPAGVRCPDDLDLDDFTAVVVATGAADVVRQLPRRSSGTPQAGRRQPVMRTAHVPPGFGNLLRRNGHFSVLSTPDGTAIFHAYTQKGGAFASLLPPRCSRSSASKTGLKIHDDACLLSSSERREGRKRRSPPAPPLSTSTSWSRTRVPSGRVRDPGRRPAAGYGGFRSMVLVADLFERDPRPRASSPGGDRRTAAPGCSPG